MSTEAAAMWAIPSTCIAALISGVASFTITDAMGGKLWIAITVSALFSILTAWVRTRPAVITAESSALINARTQTEKETSQIFERMTQLHATQAAYTQELHREQVQFLNQRLVQQNKLISLSTISKHAMLNENQRLLLHIEELRDILRDHNIGIPSLKQTAIVDITAEEDRVRAEIVGLEIQMPRAT